MQAVRDEQVRWVMPGMTEGEARGAGAGAVISLRELWGTMDR